MRKILLLSVLLISFTCVKAQYYQLGFDSVRVKSKLKLGTVTTGSATDSVLVKKGNGGVFKVARSSFGTPADSLTFRTVANSLTLAQLQTKFNLYQTVANLSTDLTASATKYPSVNAVNTGLALKANLTDLNDYTGWGLYQDNVYTTGSPLVLSAGVKRTLPNNSGVTNITQKPTDIANFYTSADSLILGRNGDGLGITIEFKVRPTTSTITRVTLAIDIGGAVGEIYVRDFILTKGDDVEHHYLSSFDTYTLDTWQTNGGKIKIVADNPAEVYNIRYIFTRTHKAR